MPAAKPQASLSLDLDDLWTYLRTRGDPAWAGYPSYLPRFLPMMLDLLERLELRITFFVVGFDATREQNRELLRAIADRGHEIGNHSYSHESWMHSLSDERLEDEVALADAALQRTTGVKPVGFRGPGYTWSPALLEVLARHQYTYDASSLPTFIGPLGRLYFLSSSQLSKEERHQRSALFGSVRDGFRPNKPYRWRLAGGRSLVEIPVTTMPVLRSPFHMSYLLYLSGFSRGLMRGYLRSALASCRLFGVRPSFLLHPLDLLGGDQVPELSFFPGMGLPTARKREVFLEVLELLADQFELVTVGTHASLAAASGELDHRVPVLVT